MSAATSRSWRSAAGRGGAGLLALVAGAWITGCTPKIGDSCALSTDCASDGTRVCDTSEPGGFCTVLNCTGNELGALCPDNALCVAFFPNVPGCPQSVRSPARTSISECRATCSTDSDCRTDYFCRDPRQPPWSAEILDPEQVVKICLPLLVFIDGGTSSQNYGYDGSIDAVAPVCLPAGPSFDAGFPNPDAAATGDAGLDGGDGGDSGPDAGDAAKSDAATDAAKDASPDAKPDATLDAGHDGPLDGMTDGSTDGSRDGSPDGADAAPKDGGPDALRDAAEAG